MDIEWVRMTSVLKPKTGNRFALIYDVVEEVIMLVDTKWNYLVMSDSWQERELNAPAIENARGDVLCLGFGIGMILLPMMAKEEVKSITVIELEQEVLDLCASQLDLNSKVRIVVADALRWIPDKKFDFIWDDCDYLDDAVKACELAGIHSDNSERLRPYLNDGGVYMRWDNDGRYRI